MDARDWVVPLVFLLGMACAVAGQTPGDPTEGFETNDFSKYPWVLAGDEDWSITRQEEHSGVYCAKSGAIGSDESTSLQVTLDCATGTITFYRKVSSESGFDSLRFSIDGVEQDEWSGEEDWAEVSFPVTEGERTFEWTYSKDGSVSEGRDTAWIDDIVFPVETEVFWRSGLYPEDWTPGDKDSLGRFLHDFSYAGYHCGEAEIPLMPPGAIVDVTQPPYRADNTGGIDATTAIQAAIDATGAIGGGIVYLPAGTYKLRPPPGSNCALRIGYSGVVLRGDGPGQTFLLNDETYMRGKSVILVRPVSGGWHSPLSGTTVSITEDVDYPRQIIPVADTARFQSGDWVVLRTDCTDEFIDEHSMTGLWKSGLRGITFYRRVTAVDTSSNSIRVDIPTRYYLKKRDNARVYKITPHIEEVGIEYLSIGMRENLTGGLANSDYGTPGTAAYEVHNSHVIEFCHVANAWIQDVHTYRPPVNTNNWHTLSNIILLNQSRSVTVRNCVVSRPQYEGGGGNGYGYTLRSNDCLLIDCTAYHTRHNYDFKSMWSSGNVIFRCQARDGRLASDFHMHLSPANLFDSMVVDGDFLEARYRPYGTTIHGQTTTESVFWNTYGTERCGSRLIVSRQWKWGYVIGTSGPVCNVQRGTQDNTAPEDLLEGQGQGSTLEPQSLYLDQLHRRLVKARNPIPGNGQTGTERAPVLLWTAGDGACWHDVYFGMDLAGIRDTDISDNTGVYRGRFTEASYAVDHLERNRTYYWRIDEVEADGTTIHKGDLWSFTTTPHGR
ncbi:MAG: hypothetical protein JSW66_01020 [Phycisphaerales bacterium]|nr:MAG: hypothetical protein JSW66_01020 [Phycisphaerales bacterium]